MYTNIPTQQIPEIISHLCKHNNIEHTTQIGILKICDTILKQNYFEFQESQYSHTQGLTIGAPTSSILSEIYLKYMEHTEIHNILHQHNIIRYFRYVDDILIVYNHKNTNIQNVLELFNNISPTLNFTIEQEVNNSIHFLDLTIYKNKKAHIMYTGNQPPQISSSSTIQSTPSTKSSDHKILNNQINNISTRRQRQRNEI